MQKIILKSTNEWVGICGLLIQDVNGELKTEVGYQFFKQYWGTVTLPVLAHYFHSSAIRTLKRLNTKKV